MKLLKEKYRKLRPTIDYLADEVVLAQAWKKTHEYIRTHNSYADTLALDISALGLEENVKGWSKSIREDSELPRHLELIPAPKSEQWIIDRKHGWIPKAQIDSDTWQKRIAKPPLRPLAHITMRDQTWASTLMLCLADAVESAQGNCSEIDFLKAQKNRVYSYGNRLLCSWGEESNDAWFRWGNAQTYRKFFEDYQNFLQRPIEIGHRLDNESNDDIEIYIVNLDLSKFYDCIDREILISRLEAIANDYHETSICSDFWKAAKKIVSWSWSTESLKKAELLNLEIGSGLPQGLVASGFLANSYLTQFDAVVGSYIDQEIAASSIKLHDYCRYVDDIRLVVSVDKTLSKSGLINTINNWFDDLLRKSGGTELRLNDNKSQIISLSDLDNKGSLSERLTILQSEISGPADRDSLDSTLGILEGLLNIQVDEFPEIDERSADKALLDLASSTIDVRTDTLKRFAANRIESIVRSKRKIDTVNNSSSSETSPLDNECELLAKKLISAWMQDPSLALLLRKAFEIFPSPTLAEPVLESIIGRSSISSPEHSDPVTQAMFDYLLADIFRNGVDFSAYFQLNALPATSNPTGLKNLLAKYSRKAITPEEVPAFVERQALLFLAIGNKALKDTPRRVSIHSSLHTILTGNTPNPSYEITALYEVASQITGNHTKYASLLLEHFSTASPDLKHRVLESCAKRGGAFWNSLWLKLKSRTEYADVTAIFSWTRPLRSQSTFSASRAQKLSALLYAKANPFQHEAALINLGLALVKACIEEKSVISSSPRDIFVQQIGSDKEEWSEIWRPGVRLSCRITHIEIQDPRYKVPNWINDGSRDPQCIYWIGTILRSAILGSLDFTGNLWKVGKVKGYKGLRTNWYKRRMGMMHAPESLVGEFSTTSKWASELLMKCLQWPGFESTFIDNAEISFIEDLDSLEDILTHRINELEKAYCFATDIPSLVTAVKRPQYEGGEKFRLVSVQHLLPRTSDFGPSDPTMDNPSTKVRNRDHISRICALTYKTLCTKLEADKDLDRPAADLIIFPEVGVHISDQDLLKRLAEKTRSIVFAGMIFVEHNNEIVNLARWFIPDYTDTGRQWIIRDQGKAFLTNIEKKYGVSPYRPCQHIIEVQSKSWEKVSITGSICYDATDLRLASDLKDKTDLFVIVAHNKDVGTFDTMASALHYHMYQHVALVNKAEFGGSTMQAPFSERHHRLISHAHGMDQISINIADLDLQLDKFDRPESKSGVHKHIKTPPAG